MTFNLPAGDLCAAKFSDGEWYRAKVEKVAGSQVRPFFKKRVNELTSNFFIDWICRSACCTSITVTGKQRQQSSARVFRPPSLLTRLSLKSTPWRASPCPKMYAPSCNVLN